MVWIRGWSGEPVFGGEELDTHLRAVSGADEGRFDVAQSDWRHRPVGGGELAA